MKHLLTAALIATALATPVRGEVFRLTCLEVTRGAEEVYLLDSFNRTAYLGTLHNGDDGVITDWNERRIMWHYTHAGFEIAVLYIYFRASGVLQEVIIDPVGITNTTYNCQLT